MRWWPATNACGARYRANVYQSSRIASITRARAAERLLPRPECRIRLDGTMKPSRAMDALPADRREMIVTWAFARLDGRAFAIASAVVTGAFLLALTLFLVVKGAPPGIPVGPHLAKLAVFFPGYTV